MAEVVCLSRGRRVANCGDIAGRQWPFDRPTQWNQSHIGIGNDGEHICRISKAQLFIIDLDGLIRSSTRGLGTMSEHVNAHLNFPTLSVGGPNLESFATSTPISAHTTRKFRNFCKSAVQISQLFQSQHFNLETFHNLESKSQIFSNLDCFRPPSACHVASGSSGVKWGTAHDNQMHESLQRISENY